MDNLIELGGRLGPTGLLSVVVIMLLTGRLVTRAAHKQVLDERDYWRDTALTALEANREHLQAHLDALEFGRTSTHLIRSLPLDGDDVAPAP